MILLLAGSTETARQMITDEFLGEHADWRHLALEDIVEEEVDDEDILGFQMGFMTMVACECAKEALQQGNNIVITCPESDMIETVFTHMPEEPICIYLGAEEEADGFDHVIDSASKSLHDISAFLNEIIQGQPA